MIASRLLMLAAVFYPTTVQLAAQEADHPPNPLATLDEAALKAFVEQPLFEQSRKAITLLPPHVYVTPLAPIIIEQPPSLRLLGVIESARSTFAVVYRTDKGKTETLRSGDRVGSWVVQITAGSLRVISDDRAFEYRIFGGGLQQGPVAVHMVPPAYVSPEIAGHNAETPAR